MGTPASALGQEGLLLCLGGTYEGRGDRQWYLLNNPRSLKTFQTETEPRWKSIGLMEAVICFSARHGTPVDPHP